MTMTKTLSWVGKELTSLKEKNLYINFKIIDSPIESKVNIDGKSFLNFSSNNYLGLANNERLIKASKQALDKYGVGPAAVRTIAGTSQLHLELENKLAKFKKAEDVVTFQSGFVANLAVVPVLVGEGDYIFSDELNHASIIDACKLTKATVIRYIHCNSKDLEQKIIDIKSIKKNSKLLIITDGVFSMDGDIAPLPKIVKVAKKYKAMTMVDDAHGEGVLGEHGRGIVDLYNLHGQVDIEVGTLSKAFGVVGGFVAGNAEIVNLLRQRARPFLFSSSMTFPDVGASIESVNILNKSDKLVKKLWQNSKYFKDRLKRLGFDIGKSETPITPVMLGDESVAKLFAEKLFEKGVFAKPITYPTVAIGKARIRVMISAAHSKSELNNALKVFEEVGRDLKII